MLILEAYLEDTGTLCDGVRLHHEVRNAGHDGGAVVAGPVAEDALHLAEAEALASVTGSDESGVKAPGHVTPVGGKCLKRRVCELQVENIVEKSIKVILHKPPHKQPHRQPGGKLGR